MVAAYAYVPRILENILNGVQGLLMDPASLDGRYRLSLGVGRFLDPNTTSPMLLALLGRVDVFTIWVTVLLAIGLAVTGKIPRSKAAIAAVLVWIIGALPAVLGAARS
jgi:VanZ family protein